MALMDRQESPHAHPQMRSPHGTACQVPTANQHVPLASGTTPMMSTIAQFSTCGMDLQHMQGVPQTVVSLIPLGTFYATIGRNHRVALGPTTAPSMHAQDAVAPPTVLKNALRCSRAMAMMPYNVNVWQDFLTRAGLMSQYPNLEEGLTHGFHAFMPPISQTFTLPNHLSIIQYKAVFNNIIHKEFSKQCSVGPLTASEVQQIVGHFQTSPLSLIPKPG